jgi:hypothetical protein
MESIISIISGEYVVPKGGVCDWVYDVKVSMNDKLIAVVGFSEIQVKGAIFWQLNMEETLKLMGHTLEIQELAREYLLQNK